MHLLRTSLALLLPLALHGACKSGSAPASSEPSQTVAPAPVAAPSSGPSAQSDAGAVAQPPKPKAASVLGAYKHPHAAFNDCDDPDGCEVEVTDTLEIADANDGAISVTAELNQDNDHSCSFEGRMNPTEPGLWSFTDASGDCRVELRQTATSIDLTSEGCREDYCGARAQLNASFPLSSRL